MPARLHPRNATRYQKALDIAARKVIRAAWRSANGRPDEAAAALDLSRSTLYREIRRLELGPVLPGFRADPATVA
jgi:transcriptional regulator of acetoin/glycerol metabolism